MKNVLLVTSIREDRSYFKELDIKYFVDKGYQVYIVVLQEKKQEIRRIHVEMDHVVWVPITFKICPISITFWQAFFKLVHLMKAHSFNIMHIYTCLGAFMSRMAAKCARIPMVIYTATPTLYFYYDSTFKELWGRTVEKIALNWTNILVTTNQRDYLIAKNELCGKKNKVYLGNIKDIDVSDRNILSPIEKTNYRRSLGISEDDFMVVVEASADRKENLLQIILAVAHHVKNGAKIKLVILGEGYYKERYKEQVLSLRMGENIIFKEDEDIKMLLSCCDVVGVFSRSEYVSDSLIRAVCSLKAIICINTLCNRDWVIDGVNGFLVENHDVEQTVQKLKVLYDSPILVKGFQEANRSLINRYSLQKSTEEIRAIYDKELVDYLY